MTRAEGKTNVRPTLDDDADVGEFPDEATEPVLATVYHERRMQAERVDVHAPAPVSFLFLFSRGVAYQLTDEACHTAPIHHAMTNARLAQAATFLGKVNITRVAAFDDDVPDARSDSGSDSDADSDADARPSDSPSPSSGARPPPPSPRNVGPTWFRATTRPRRCSWCATRTADDSANPFATCSVAPIAAPS